VVTGTGRVDPAITATGTSMTNGAALAAFLGGGIGAFATGFFVIANEVGLVPAPSLYAPAGGVSGRTTFAVVAWLIAWAILHYRWKDRNLDARRIHVVTLALVALGVLFTFPPFWSLL
jgi:hypothetical protein